MVLMRDVPGFGTLLVAFCLILSASYFGTYYWLRDSLAKYYIKTHPSQNSVDSTTQVSTPHPVQQLNNNRNKEPHIEYGLNNPLELQPEHVRVPMEIQFFAGAIGGLMSWIFVYPADVIKTEMQSHHGAAPGTQFVSATSCIKKFLEPKNRYKLFKGMSPCLIGSIPACGMTFLVYESLVALANKKLYGV